MTVTALVSGGKDSVYAAYLSDTQGWPVDELVTLRPDDPESMLFHVPNLDLVALQAEAWGRRHRSVAVRGRGEAAELDALERALAGVRGPVVAGAIASSYQWARLVRIADRLGRRVYAPLWRKDPARVVREEIAAGLDIRLVHLAADPLPAEWVGSRLDTDRLAELERRADSGRRMNVAGEGGEYETLVVDAPFFSQRIEIDASATIVTGSTARLDISSAHLKRKKIPGSGRPLG
ncbi:MAG TPA: diphthine--ammonia ligase [Thermoplasmata archaeon]|nr:diphthine--ammonia ligase [Thermoplasmata archaeon]